MLWTEKSDWAWKEILVDNHQDYSRTIQNWMPFIQGVKSFLPVISIRNTSFLSGNSTYRRFCRTLFWVVQFVTCFFFGNGCCEVLKVHSISKWKQLVHWSWLQSFVFVLCLWPFQVRCRILIFFETEQKWENLLLCKFLNLLFLGSFHIQYIYKKFWLCGTFEGIRDIGKLDHYANGSAQLASKVFTAAKKLPSVGLNLKITGV